MELKERLGLLLIEKGMTIAIAESCTGGLIAKRITDVPGASRYFEAGTVTYSNRSKVRLLGVPLETINLNGAVSEEVASCMASGVKELTGSDIGLSVTGIAGPEGGTEDKPVGTVYIGLSAGTRLIVRRFNFAGTRKTIREKTADAALMLVIDYLEGRLE